MVTTAVEHKGRERNNNPWGRTAPERATPLRVPCAQKADGTAQLWQDVARQRDFKLLFVLGLLSEDGERAACATQTRTTTATRVRGRS
jgi:hypothetical protein